MTLPRHSFPLMALSAAISSVAEAQIQTAPDNISTLEGTSVTFNVLANDTSDLELPLSVRTPVVTAPRNGEVVFDQQTEQHTYIPAQGYTGTDSFTYEAEDTDDYGEPVVETVTITINAAPSDTDLEDQVTGENSKAVARTISRICDSGEPSTELEARLCFGFTDEEADTAIDQITPPGGGRKIWPA